MPARNELAVALSFKQFLSSVVLRIFQIQHLEPLLLQCGKDLVCAKSKIEEQTQELTSYCTS